MPLSPLASNSVTLSYHSMHTSPQDRRTPQSRAPRTAHASCTHLALHELVGGHEHGRDDLERAADHAALVSAGIFDEHHPCLLKQLVPSLRRREQVSPVNAGFPRNERARKKKVGTTEKKTNNKNNKTTPTPAPTTTPATKHQRKHQHNNTMNDTNNTNTTNTNTNNNLTQTHPATNPEPYQTPIHW